MKVLVRRQYIYVGRTGYGDLWASPGEVERVVWRADKGESQEWAVEVASDKVPAGYALGMLFCEIDGKPVAIEQVEEATGIHRDEILRQIEGASP